jgi:hypothetical protein
VKLSYSAVREVLQTCGPLTMREVAAYFPDVPYQNVGSVLSAMRRKVAAKQIYIHSWTREGIGRTYLRAVYALGKKKDAPKPPLITESERCNKYRQRMKVTKPDAARSVFEWRGGL